MAVAARLLGASGRWTPRKLPGVAAWFCAEDVAGSDGSAVASWGARIGGITVSQATGAARPLLKTGVNGINGRPVLRFASASSQFLSAAIGTLPAKGPLAYLIVMRVTTGGIQRVVSVGKAGTTGVGYGVGFSGSNLLLTTYGVADNVTAWGWPASGAVGFGIYELDGVNTATFSRSALNPLRSATGAGAGNLGADTFTIGGRSTTSQEWFNGDIAEIVICSQTLTTADIVRFGLYAQRRYGSLSSTFYNSAASVATPSGDASGTCVENCVVDMGVGGWNGHRYWNGFVPFGSNNNANENPSINYSDDGNTWTTPAGLTNPVVAYPGGGSAGNNADPGLFYNAADGKMYLFYVRENALSSIIGVWVTSSSDGVSWSAPARVVNSVATDADFEPKVIQPTAGTWWLYTVDGRVPAATTLSRRISTTGPAAGYGAAAPCTLTLPGGRQIWHLGPVTRIGSKYVSAVSDNDSQRNIWIISSLDGLTWRTWDHPSLVIGGGWESGGSAYRFCIADAGDGVNMHAWYTALSPPTQMSQMVTIPLTEIP